MSHYHPWCSPGHMADLHLYQYVSLFVQLEHDRKASRRR